MVTYIEIGIVTIGYILLRIWAALGGWPEAYWRIRRIPYFLAFILETDGQILRKPLKAKIIERHSPARFPFREGDYLVGGNEETFRSRGRPAWLYNWDDTRPLPLYVKGAEKIPPSLIQKGFKNNVIERTHAIGRPRTKFQALLVIMVLIAVLMAGLAAYYSYNTACATHSSACIQVGR